MNSFLSNLITRHQVENKKPENFTVVQPRPKSRFETASSYETPPTVHHHEVEAQENTNLKQSPSDPETVEHKKSDTEILPPAPKDNTKGEKELIASLKQPFEQKHRPLEEPVVSITNKSDEQNNSLTESTIFRAQPISQNISIHDGLHSRIQTILKHIHHRSQNAASQSSAETQNSIMHPGIVPPIEKSLAGKPEKFLFSTENSLEHNSAQKIKTQVTESTPNRRNTDRDGLLQPPNGLGEIQSILNNRLQASAPLQAPEPVVNVTIGRIEIKAIQEDSPKIEKISNKPSGIMNLDDYLAQRNKGRS